MFLWKLVFEWNLRFIANFLGSVLILVFVEVGFWVKTKKEFVRWHKCLNPCFCGSWFLRGQFIIFCFLVTYPSKKEVFLRNNHKKAFHFIGCKSIFFLQYVKELLKKIQKNRVFFNCIIKSISMVFPIIFIDCK